jgi:hypothetical protein
LFLEQLPSQDLVQNPSFGRDAIARAIAQRVAEPPPQAPQEAPEDRAPTRITVRPAVGAYPYDPENFL